MSVLNNPKGKPVLLTLQYTIRIILNHIKYSRNHIQNSTLQRKSNNQNILHYRSNNMTPYLTSDNDAKLKHGSDYIQNHNVTLNCDITPLLKLLYNNNLHIHKAMSTISTIHKIQITKIQTIYKSLYYERNYQHINMNILSCSGSQLRYSPSLGCLPL